jgi:hypothetical protein
MIRRRLLILPFTLVSLWAAGAVAHAAGRVELELLTDARAPITSQQEWLQRLSQAGVSNLRIRARRLSDQVGIEVRGTDAAPIYAVTGLIDSGGEVHLPGARFRTTEAARLVRWLDELARFGPSRQPPAKSAFGLSAEQFEEVHRGLSRPLGFSTEGVPRREVVEKIVQALPLPVGSDPQILQAIQDVDVVAEELSGLSGGTALAYVVRPLGACLVPRAAGAGKLQCVLVKARPNTEAWPIGWEPEKHRSKLVPGLFEFLNVNVQGVAVTQVLETVAQRLEVPVLMDYNALARHGIEPDQAMVNHPQRRTSYTLLLKRTLYQAGLKSEVRVDEAGKPFLWVTTVKPI